MAAFFVPMKMTYSDLQAQFLRNINFTGSTNTDILADFKQNLNNRYQMVFAQMQDYQTQVSLVANTVVNQQFYHYPTGVVNIEDVVVTIGSIRYVLKVINSQQKWDEYNAIQIQPTAIPQFIFPRRDDFGIWPIPQGVYTITFNYHLRDRDLSVPDYTVGTATFTSQTVTVLGQSTVWTPSMQGRWIQITDTSAWGQGYWYRIASINNAGSLVLDATYQQPTSTAVTYRIGQVPEIPDEGHIILCDGATADFYGGMRKDYESMKTWNNRFWTGDPVNESRDEGDSNVKAGLIGLMSLYGDRNNSKLIDRRPRIDPLQYQVWATSISA